MTAATPLKRFYKVADTAPAGAGEGGFAVRLDERARAAGVESVLEVWDDMVHVWHYFADMLPEGREAIERIGEFIRERTA